MTGRVTPLPLRILAATGCFLLAALAFTLPGSDSRLPGAAQAQTEGQPEPLVVLEEDEPQTTYPFLARTMSEQRLSELLFDRLFVASTGGDLVSRVFADGWSARPPNLSLAVRPDLKFSNGAAATFSDIAFTLNDVYRRTDLGHPVGEWYGRVFGDSQQITPLNGSIRFLVSMPDDGSERYLATTILLSREALSRGGGKPDLESTKRQPVGTGPFYAARTIESFDDVLLQRNPNRPAAPQGEGELRPVNALRLLYDQDAARQKELMEGSRADVWVSPPPAVLPPFRNQSDLYGLRTYDLMQWWYVALDPKHAMLSDARVREALDLVVPRGQLVDKFGAESATQTSGPFLPGSAWAAADEQPTPEDKKRSAELMQAAGFQLVSGTWTKGGEGMSLRFGVQDDILDDYNDVVYGLVDAWESNGFRVRVRGIRAADWRDAIEAGKANEQFDIVLGRWNLDREEGVLELFATRSGKGRVVNLFGYSNPEVDVKVQEFYKETSGPKREALMQRLHRTLHDDRPYLFLWTLQVQSVYRRDRVSGFRPAPFYYFTGAEGLVWRGPPAK
jgi:peptide/nickel transport system substrate-binding protein